MMEPAVAAFREALASVPIGDPVIPFMSTSLCGWVRSAQELGADYWSQHIRRPVLFADAIAKVLAEFDTRTVFLELGPRDVLATLARLQAPGARKARIVATLGDAAGEPAKDLAAATASVGRLWALGVNVDWEAYRGGQQRRRIPLPNYPFERRSHWLEPLKMRVAPGTAVLGEGAPLPFVEPTLARLTRTQ
jgi:acyl transferase domain-containing protein